MYIGDKLTKRMQRLHITTETLADQTFLEPDYIQSIQNNQIPLNHISDFDLQLLCTALHCSDNYFTNGEQDMLDEILLTAKDTQQSATIKTNIHNYLQDFQFITDIERTNS